MSDSFLPHTDKEGRIYREIRCQNCRKLLGYEFVRDGRLRFECPKCGRTNILIFRNPRSAIVEDAEPDLA